MIKISTALLSLVPGSQFGIENNDYSTITWYDTNECALPSYEEVQTEIIKLEAEWLRNEYQRQRKPEYPPITDQLDALFHAGVFPPEMAAQIQAIKDKYPKPLDT